MAAPKGNKYAYKNPLNTGAPKIYTDEFIEKEAQALVQWAEEEDALILREFPAFRGYVPSTFYEFVNKNKVFADAFNHARNIIGIRREQLYIEKNSDKPYLKYANYHDDQIAEFERKEKAFEATLKAAQEMKPVSDEEKSRHEALMSLLLSMQDSARNKAETKSKADNKS